MHTLSPVQRRYADYIDCELVFKLKKKTKKKACTTGLLLNVLYSSRLILKGNKCSWFASGTRGVRWNGQALGVMGEYLYFVHIKVVRGAQNIATGSLH